MSKDEAIQAMKEGKKVTHRFFTPTEFITMRSGHIVDELGYHLNAKQFWSFREHESFETDWSIYEPQLASV